MSRHGSGERRGPLPGLVGRALALGYRAAIARINRRFDAGRRIIRFDRPVISVGNLSVGGTGKTPLVEFLVRALLDAGHRPCIAMRGYRGADDSDEAAAYRRAFPDVPIVARANRTLGLIQRFAHEHDEDGPHTDCIVLDDGFQHRQIARDMDIVVIDATRDPFSDRLLPAGWLRDPVSSLKRAGAVVLTHAESVQPADITALDQRIGVVRSGRGADAIARHGWRSLIVAEAGGEREEPIAWLAGRKLLAVAAIGNPGPFFAQARRAAAGMLAGEIRLRDHDAYGAGTIQRIVDAARGSRAQAILTTEKDWSKLAHVPHSTWPCPVARARLVLGFDRGGDRLVQAMLATVAKGAPE